jgi:radical SAM protein with 4Fe4S-binding SPASM domain
MHPERRHLSPSEKLFELTRASNIPLICTFELTQRCNYRCRHCYIDHAAARTSRGELSTRRVRTVLDELKAAGTLSLVFTGGEIFLRPDILKLCADARERGFDLRIFTNGSLLTERAARYLASLSLGGVELSLYGPRTTHDAVTRRRGSFTATLRAVRVLRRSGVAVTVKAPLMTLNVADLPWLKRFAEQEQVRLKLDPILVPRNDGDRAVLAYRLDTGTLRTVYRDPALFSKDAPCADEGKPDPGCSAGRNLVAIAWDGTVYPCLQLMLPLGNLRRTHFSDIWHAGNKILSRYRSIGPTDAPACRSCADASVCQRCPGLALLETGDITAPVPIACTVASIIKSL